MVAEAERSHVLHGKQEIDTKNAETPPSNISTHHVDPDTTSSDHRATEIMKFEENQIENQKTDPGQSKTEPGKLTLASEMA